MTLRWRKVADWNLSQSEQVIWTAVGRSVEYKITRSRTADRPIWRLYTRAEDGMEECQFVSSHLGICKNRAVKLEGS